MLSGGNAGASSGLALALSCLLFVGCTSPAPDVPVKASLAESAPPSIPIKVLKPDGAGPFPAVVVLHDCSGLGPRSSGAPARWAKVLLREGYVVLIPDSFSTRGHADGVCTDSSPGRFEVSPNRRVRDAYEALAFARSLPYVDGAHVGVMGGSHGGSTTLATMVVPHDAGFAAAVALYPGCGARRYGEWRVGSPGAYKPDAPLLILIGELDDWTPAEPCRQLAQGARDAGYPVSIKIYPGARHGFDSRGPVRYLEARVNMNAPGGRGATTGGNPEAWADSIREVSAFFGRYLRGVQPRRTPARASETGARRAAFRCHGATCRIYSPAREENVPLQPVVAIRSCSAPSFVSVNSPPLAKVCRAIQLAAGPSRSLSSTKWTSRSVPFRQTMLAPSAHRPSPVLSNSRKRAPSLSRMESTRGLPSSIVVSCHFKGSD